MAQRSFEEVTDFRFRNEGSIALLTPQTPMAQQWVEEHIDTHGEVTWFGASLVIEHRYVSDILHGVHEDGLTVEAT